ncbi:N-formylglutamate amidohydrolase [soil metagenome]
MTDAVYRLALPDTPRSCAVFSSPHSGRDYPPGFLSRTRLDTLQIRSSEDAYVDELFACAPDHGAPLLAARVPRACVDLNRASDELDPALIAGTFRRGANPRVVAGLGVIPRVVAEGRPIIEGKLSLAEAEARLDTYYHPYHACLAALIEAQRRAFGQALLFDCHSMPHDALASAPAVWGKRPNIILGDRFGASCERWLMEAATEIFGAAGFVVARNAPFAGGFITQHYGRPGGGIQALQIEIDRGLYMDEDRIERRAGFAETRATIAGAVARLARLGSQALPMAAE